MATSVNIPVPWGYIAGKAWGDPGGQPVLAMHGLYDNAGSFDKLVPLLSKDLYVIAIDLPGHGQSSHRHHCTRYHLLDNVDDVKKIVDTLEWKTFSFLCHSYSTNVAIFYAAARPDQVKSVILIDPPGVMAEPVENIPVLMGYTLSFPLATKSNKIFPTWNDILERTFASRYDSDTRITHEVAEILAIRGSNKVEGGYCFSHDPRLKEPFLLFCPDILYNAFSKQISCPTLVIKPKESDFCLESSFSKVYDAIPKDKLKLVEIPGGHYVHIYNPETLSSLVSLFLLTCTIHSNYKLASRL